ncbi:hypothetical protein V3C10_14635 [[Clostridium] symbiosum]|uniref:hypothetical protein n=1 Tax=Clostridium symbiosum TaxID=1512 RepID=UPI001D08538A|nr:hypothetical protein [[Clostridium] symbiosum]MCB6609853.1 hypothetical protein [[Clostridium] symbiosum]MCB6933222.1 hypothetical protein [[Clostridium] symbiosum]
MKPIKKELIKLAILSVAMCLFAGIVLRFPIDLVFELFAYFMTFLLLPPCLKSREASLPFKLSCIAVTAAAGIGIIYHFDGIGRLMHYYLITFCIIVAVSFLCSYFGGRFFRQK